MTYLVARYCWRRSDFGKVKVTKAADDLMTEIENMGDAAKTA
jgi:hypothetical protein